MAVLRTGTSERGGTFWTEGETISILLERDHQIKSEILEAGRASIENARRLDENKIDLAFMASNWIGRAYHGEVPFQQPIDIRMVAPANCGAMFFITRANSDLRNVRDMVGKRVSIGPEGSGMVQHIHTIFGALGIAFEEFTPVYLSFEEGGKALEEGEVDAQWQCPYPNKVMKSISERFDIRVLEYLASDLSRIMGDAKFYRRSIMPAGFFRGLEIETEQLAVVNIIAAHARTNVELVHKYVSTILKNLEELAQINPLFIGLEKVFQELDSEGQKCIEFGGTPIHPGAIQAYKDAGYRI